MPIVRRKISEQTIGITICFVRSHMHYKNKPSRNFPHLWDILDSFHDLHNELTSTWMYLTLVQTNRKGIAILEGQAHIVHGSPWKTFHSYVLRSHSCAKQGQTWGKYIRHWNKLVPSGCQQNGMIFNKYQPVITNMWNISRQFKLVFTWLVSTFVCHRGFRALTSATSML